MCCRMASASTAAWRRLPLSGPGPRRRRATTSLPLILLVSCGALWLGLWLTARWHGGGRRVSNAAVIAATAGGPAAAAGGAQPARVDAAEVRSTSSSEFNPVQVIDHATAASVGAGGGSAGGDGRMERHPTAAAHEASAPAAQQGPQAAPAPQGRVLHPDPVSSAAQAAPQQPPPGTALAAAGVTPAQALPRAMAALEQVAASQQQQHWQSMRRQVITAPATHQQPSSLAQVKAMAQALLPEAVDPLPLLAAHQAAIQASYTPDWHLALRCVVVAGLHGNHPSTCASCLPLPGAAVLPRHALLDTSSHRHHLLPRHLHTAMGRAAACEQSQLTASSCTSHVPLTALCSHSVPVQAPGAAWSGRPRAGGRHGPGPDQPGLPARPGPGAA